MKKIVVLITFVIIFSSFISAEIIINQQPQDTYSLGDTIRIPVTIKTVIPISGIFEMNLLCNGHEINFYKNGVGLEAGEEQDMDPSLVLTKEIIGEIQGDCVIKSTLGKDYFLSNDFKISNIITLSITSEKTEFEPGNPIMIKGGATKENGENVNGFIEFQIGTENATESIAHTETISNGFFLANITTPKNMKAGAHTVNINAYEKDISGEITNAGVQSYNIYIKQIPTSLEIIFENAEVEPGTNLMVKAILHDQTGEKIGATAIITIKNQKDKIIEQTEIATDEFFVLPIKYNQAPEEWKVVAVSNKLTSEIDFKIQEKKDIKIEIINKTLILTNKGNVPYNDNILIKIGEESLNLNASLDVDGEQKYILSAPDGTYNVEVLGVNEEVMLTGKTIDIKKTSGVVSFVRYPFVWIFMIAILGFVAFMIVRKGYKRSFFGHIKSKISKSKRREMEATPLGKNSLIKTKNKAELSLSIKGEKQNISLASLKIKNLHALQSKKGSAKETLQKIIDMAEENKAQIYENQDHIFFILAPAKTKTFKNEKTALKIAQNIQEALAHHNKLFQQKIDFGIALNYGAIIAKQEPKTGTLRFMSLGTLITSSKKISSIAHNEILLGEKISEQLVQYVKTEKQMKHGVPVYSIKQIKNSEDHSRFLARFIKSIEQDKKK